MQFLQGGNAMWFSYDTWRQQLKAYTVAYITFATTIATAHYNEFPGRAPKQSWHRFALTQYEIHAHSLCSIWSQDIRLNIHEESINENTIHGLPWKSIHWMLDRILTCWWACWSGACWSRACWTICRWCCVDKHHDKHKVASYMNRMAKLYIPKQLFRWPRYDLLLYRILLKTVKHMLNSNSSPCGWKDNQSSGLSVKHLQHAHRNIWCC